MKSIQNPITVCHLISGDLWAGAEVMASHLIKSIAISNTIVVKAIVFNHGRLAEELKIAGIDVTVIDESQHSFPVLAYKVYKVLHHKNVTILHAHRRKENLIVFIVAYLLGNIKLVSTLHGMPEFYKSFLSKNSIVTKLDFLILSLCFNRTVVVSNDMREILTHSKRFSQSKTLAIHNGIPLPAQSNRVSDCTSKTFTIGSAGRLVPVKDFGLFIAIANLLSNNNTIRFLLAGEGPLHNELKQKHSELHLHNFIFLGHIEDMNNFYSQIDVFVNTSVHEGIPMTLLEAMSRGIPVVAPSTGGIPEIIDNGVDGFLINNRDPRQYAEKCSFLSANQDKHRTMAEAAKDKIIDKFSISTMTKRYLQTYSEIAQPI